VRHLLGPAGILDDKAVEFGIRLVRRTGLVERYQPLLTHTLGKDRSRITVEGFLVGMTLLSCVLRRPPELTEAATVLFEMVPVKWDGRFQRKESEPFRRTTNRKPPTEKERLAFYAAVRRLWGQFSLTMDAFPYPKDRRLTLDEVKELPRLPADEAARRDANLDEVCNILLGATVELAREILPIDSWEMLHAVDATVMEANARPPTKELASAEVEGTVYMRSVPITPTRTSTKTGKPIKRRDTPRTTKEKVEWGYEVTIDSTAPNPRNEYRDLPEFAVSMTIHGCGADWSSPREPDTVYAASCRPRNSSNSSGGLYPMEL